MHRTETAAGTRAGTHHPRQLRLPGQAAAPAGPVDLFRMFLMHHAFRRDVAAFAATVPVTPVDDRQSWRRLAARWALFARALHHHHGTEDRWLWPALLERATADERAMLESMKAEHGDIDPLLEVVATGLDELAADADHDTRAALAVRVVAARESLGRHLAREETDALRIVQARLTPAEWHAVEARSGDGTTLRDLVALVPWAVHGLPERQLAEVFERSGRAHRVVWRLTRRRFARQQARTFAQNA